MLWPRSYAQKSEASGIRSGKSRHESIQEIPKPAQTMQKRSESLGVKATPPVSVYMGFVELLLLY